MKSYASAAEKRTGHPVVWFAALPWTARRDPRKGDSIQAVTESVRVWSCCHCDKSGPWADGWTYLGSILTDDEGFAECVTCPACSKHKHHKQGPGPGKVPDNDHLVGQW